MSRRREIGRLQRAFQCALIAAGCPGIVVACGTSATTSHGADSGAPTALHDGSTDGADVLVAGSNGQTPEAGVDAALPTDATVDAAPKKPPVDAGSGGCFGGSFELDGGPDADPDADTCEYIYGCDITGGGLMAVGCQIFLIGPDGGPLPFSYMTCFAMQDAGCDEDALAPNAAGGMNISCSPCPGGGRRTAGLRVPNARGGRPAGSKLGAYLARMAFEESASIAAFERMYAELAALGAPRRLVASAARAAQDEVRHTRTMSTLAAANGGAVTNARMRRARPRSVSAIAAENAAEGCVRETYGALLARWQAAHAGDIALRRALTRIAQDEAAHAALSWEVARWLEPRLGAGERARVARARAKALAALREDLAREPHDTLVQAAGLPRAKTALTLLDALATSLDLDAAPVQAAPRGSHRHPLAPA